MVGDDKALWKAWSLQKESCIFSCHLEKNKTKIISGCNLMTGVTSRVFPLYVQVDVLIKRTNPVCLFAIVHPSAHPLYAGGPEGVAKRARVH